MSVKDEDVLITTVHQLQTLARGRRKELGLTQAELAKAAGVSRKWVSEFETGRTNHELPQVLRALDALGLRLHLNTDGQPAPTTNPSAPVMDLDAILEGRHDT